MTADENDFRFVLLLILHLPPCFLDSPLATCYYLYIAPSTASNTTYLTDNASAACGFVTIFAVDGFIIVRHFYHEAFVQLQFLLL